jgi:hypothetical protein
MKLRRALAAALLSAWVVASPASGGSYSKIVRCADDGCFPASVTTDPGQPVNVFGITHPGGYVRTGGAIQVPICVSGSSPSLVGPTQRAIATWNALTPITGNCLGCVVWEEPLPTTGAFHAESVILHEMGHCALGLGHPDRWWDPEGDGSFEPTSYSLSVNAGHPGGITAGPDGIRGSFDDVQLAPGGANPADSASWFRIADNNPFVVDDTVIDLMTFTRSVATNLPDDNFAANGNRKVAESLGFPVSQAVMYSRGVRGMQYSGLTADDVNMVRMGRTGEDLMAGTADDYTIELVFVSDCEMSPSAIRVTFNDLGPNQDPASCEGLGLDYSFPPVNPFLMRHYTLIELLPPTPPFIRLNSFFPWDTGPPLAPVVFQDGFESADLSAWDDAVSALGVR